MNKRIDKEVDFFNKSYGNWEQLKRVELLPKEFSIEGGELTPTLKLKRKAIMELHAAAVARVYPK
jgi:long-chain acyl-CoA synthetase